MSIIERIENWQRERLLDKQEYRWEVEALNILEELFEGITLNTNHRITPREMGERVINDLRLVGFAEELPEAHADLLCDIIVFAVGGLMKLGCEPRKAMEETLKEIESRSGSIGKDGKWHKDKSKEAKTKWYKADYSKCLKEQ